MKSVKKIEPIMINYMQQKVCINRLPIKVCAHFPFDDSKMLIELQN